jgi:Predicted PP-loop superfamily ATPase
MVEEAIIQLTGGIDSTVLAYYLKDKYVLHGTFIYYDYPYIKHISQIWVIQI